MPGDAFVSLDSTSYIGPSSGAVPCTIVPVGTAMPAALALRSQGDPSWGYWRLAAAIGRNGTGRAVAWNSNQWWAADPSAAWGPAFAGGCRSLIRVTHE